MILERFTVIPAIDLKEGQVVRLQQGAMERSTVYHTAPDHVARSFAQEGAELIHVVDLDGAVAGAPRNLEALRRIRRATSCYIEFSGGLRTIESVRQALSAGADFISIGSAAVLHLELLKKLCAELPGRVFGSLDLRDDRVVIKGWLEGSELAATDAVRRFEEAGVRALIVTDVARDGTEAGVNTTLFSTIARVSNRPVIASGGVGGLDSIRTVRRCFADGVVGVIVGRALYERRFTLGDALAVAADDDG
jgi:phosphoribosylformimino-5-aminoimidazole carboxamide ribotide isomerase